jgi:hypothetical protein
MFGDTSLNIGRNSGVVGVIGTAHDIDAVFSLGHTVRN